jgi:hypothetical protein
MESTETNMKNVKKTAKFLGLGLLLALTLAACNNFFHELIPPDGEKIIYFKVEGQIGEAVIGDYTIMSVVSVETDITSLVPFVIASPKASVLPITFNYIQAAFPSVDIFAETRNFYTANDLSDYVINLIKNNPDFNIPALDIPIDFSGQVNFLVISAQGSIRQYKVSVIPDSGEPKLTGFNFTKYDNPELVKDAVSIINEGSRTIYAYAVYPVEMTFLSYALIPSFEIIGDKLEVDGNVFISGQSEIQFTRMFGTQNKTITVWRDGQTTDYTLIIAFEEDPDTIRSITDFRFNKTDNPGIAANAVASIINTESTGAINIQIFYSGAQPSSMIPSFISPGTVSINGVQQTSGVNSHDFSSPVEYSVVSRNGQYTRTYTVKTELINFSEAAPRILSFKFAQNVNPELVQDTVGEISDGLIMIDAHYGGAYPPETLIPEFLAQGLVTVLSGVQISGSSGQNFNRQIKYTVTNPVNPLLYRDYWVQTRMLRDTSSDARIDSFGFYPEDNPILSDVITGKVDQITGKIVIYAPSGSGAAARLMIPRFTGVGIVNVGGIVQSSGVSGQLFDAPITYTVVSANGINRRNYTVELRELTSRIHVNANAFGNNDGTTWQNAFRSLKSACEASFEFPDDINVEIWIAAGTYTPGNNAADYFRLAANTSFTGGFAGYETAKSQRNIAANKVTISGNLGGAVYARRLFASDSYLTGDLSFENLRFTSVRGTAGADSCIFAQFSAAAGISVTNCEFIDLTTPNAAVYAQGGSAVISNCTFTGCAVNVQGTSARISDVNFSNCTNNDTLKLNCSGETEIKRVNISDFSGIAVNLSGNGNKILETINIRNGVDGIWVGNTTGDFRAQGVTLQTLSGGGVIMSAANGVKYISGITGYNISAGAINCNSNTTTSGTFTLMNGEFDRTGMVLFNGVSINILNTGITNSTASSAINITASGDTVIDEVIINGVPYGRGIMISGNGNASISNTVIKNCVATTLTGGGMSITGSGTAYIYNTTIENCKTTMNSGGGAHLQGTVTMNNCTISGNTAINSGGGIFITNGTLNMNDCTISNNICENSNGGGIYINGGTLNMNGGTISDNTNRNASGGGVYVTTGNFTMQGNAVISRNSVNPAGSRGNSFGGGVYVTNGTFTMINGSIANNSIYSGYSGNSFGGGVCAHTGGKFIMQGGTISGNTIRNNKSAKGAGVALCNSYFDLDLYGSSSFSKTGGTIYGIDDINNANLCMNLSNGIYPSSNHSIDFDQKMGFSITLGPSNNFSYP